MPYRSAIELVQAQLEAFNAKDLETLLQTFSADAEIFALHGRRLAAGRAALSEWFMLEWRRNDPHVDLLSRTQLGETVIDRERIVNRAQGCAGAEVLCTYQVEGGVIRRATFGRQWMEPEPMETLRGGQLPASADHAVTSPAA